MSCLFRFDVLVICLLLCEKFSPDLVVTAKSRNTIANYRTEESSPVLPNYIQVADRPSLTHELWFPFIVALQRWILPGEWFHSCSGSIISADVVLTSCQCIGKETTGNRMSYYFENWVRVIAGSRDSDSPNLQTARVKGFKAHPSCTYPGSFLLTSDVGFVFLLKPFVFNLAIRPLIFPTRDVSESYASLNMLIEHETKCYTPGWGTTDISLNGSVATFSVHPSLTTVQIISEEQCKMNFCSLHSDKCERNFSEYNQVCVLAFPDSPSCFSDIGGPLICNGYVVGVASWTVDHCVSHSPDIFSDIRAILDVLKFYGHENNSPVNGQSVRLTSGQECPSSIPISITIVVVYYTTLLIP
uniref:Chymotrypsin A n=1 Tax=Lygus hesperus TaxID=30085 RepID=A0A0A9WJJ6_LYGHE